MCVGFSLMGDYLFPVCNVGLPCSQGINSRRVSQNPQKSSIIFKNSQNFIKTSKRPAKTPEIPQNVPKIPESLKFSWKFPKIPKTSKISQIFSKGLESRKNFSDISVFLEQ